MSTIDEIMEAVESVKTAAAEHQRWPSAMRRIILGKETEGLCDLIAAALADAERKGAEAMQAGAFDACVAQADADRRFAKSERNAGAVDCATELAEIIRALPLPTGSQS